jgi:SAM-dependent methyltransferase
MNSEAPFHLADVQAVYSGPERRLWELLMGEQIHIGGFQSSMDLAERAGISPGQQGVDLCCASGAGMRCLVRFRDISKMTGVDATPAMVALGRQRCLEEGLSDRVTFVEAHVCESGLPSAQFDFVWGEDAWCYVEDKARLIAEAARLVKPGGMIAFTDWVEGPRSLLGSEADRFFRFMKFPNLFRFEDYRVALTANGCVPRVELDTGRFAGQVKLYLAMLESQLTYDALKIVGFDRLWARDLLEEMRFMRDMAESGKIAQGLLIAKKQP